MIGETDAERRERLNRSNTKFARDVCDRLFPDDQVWWELEMKNTLGIKSHEASNDGIVASEFKAFGGNVLPVSSQKISRNSRSAENSESQRAPPRTLELLIIIQYNINNKEVRETKKKKKEDDISLQMQEMSIDSPEFSRKDRGLRISR